MFLGLRYWGLRPNTLRLRGYLGAVRLLYAALYGYAFGAYAPIRFACAAISAPCAFYTPRFMATLLGLTPQYASPSRRARRDFPYQYPAY